MYIYIYTYHVYIYTYHVYSYSKWRFRAIHIQVIYRWKRIVIFNSYVDFPKDKYSKYRFVWKYGVLINTRLPEIGGGTPKSYISVGFSMIHHSFWATVPPSQEPLLEKPISHLRGHTSSACPAVHKFFCGRHYFCAEIDINTSFIPNHKPS